MKSRFDRIQELVLEARQQPGARRREWLAQACSGDEELLADVQSLLDHDDPDDPRLRTGGVIVLETSEKPPAQIGAFHVLEKIGEGGFGEVYVAEQREPLRRKVAIKILKRGMDTKAILARFAAERQALALMEHPNIARILDAGETDAGLPYFAMDWIRGQRITDYCDSEKLPLEERLRLFVSACSAIEHAHSRGVIHRDIKPSNILVATTEGRPHPKVIDFGIAKAISSPLTDQTVFTVHGQIMGTPAYMSPEQATPGGEVTPASDVYSLGAVLYELLTGAPPGDDSPPNRGSGGSTGPPDRNQVVPPSERLTQLGHRASSSTASDQLARVANSRSTTPSALRKELRSGLDWIALRSLETHPEHRYPRATDLADDVQRFLEGRAVIAAPAHGLDRFGRLARHRVARATGSVTHWAGRIGLAVSNAMQAQRIAEERDRARRELDRSERMSDFLAETLASVEPNVLGLEIVDDLRARIRQALEQRGRSATEIERDLAQWQQGLEGVNTTDTALRLLHEQVLSRAGRTIDEKLGDEPQIAARIRATFGVTYRDLGLYAEAEPYLREALRQRRALFGPDHAETINSLNSLSRLLQEQEQWEEAESVAREVLSRSQRALGADHPETLVALANLGTLLTYAGRMEEAETYRRRSVNEHLRVLGESHRESIKAIGNLGVLLVYRGAYDEAEVQQRRCLELSRRYFGDEAPTTMTALGNLGQLLEQTGKSEEAEEICREVLRVCRHVQGNHHYDTFVALINLGATLDAHRQYAEAEECFREALTGLTRTLGPDHSRTLGANHNLGCVLKSMGRLAEAEPHLAEGLARTERILGSDHLHTLIAMGHYGDILRLQERTEEANAVLSDAIERADRSLSPDDWLHAVLWHRRGLCQLVLGRPEVAEEEITRAYHLYAAALGAQQPRTLEAARDLARVSEAQGKEVLAREWMGRATPGDGQGDV